MSFEMKYDRDGLPIAPKQTPNFEQEKEVSQNINQQQIEEQSVAAESSPSYENEQVTDEVDSDVQEKPKKPTPQESFNTLKKKAERLERERDEYLRMLNTAKEVAPEKTPDHSSSTQDFDLSLGEDDIAEGKHLNKMRKEMLRLQGELKKTQQMSYENQVEARLKASYPDFDAVVTKENIEMLRNDEPEIASTLNSAPDLYSKALSTYKMIKKLGYTNTTQILEEKVMAQKNINKPRPSNSVSPQRGESPLAKANAFANGLTDELKAQLLKEMNEARKNR